MKLKAFILILLSIPLLSFLVVWDGRYHPDGVMEIRAFKKAFKKGMRASGKEGDYSLACILEYRADKIYRYTHYDFGDTIKFTIYNYEGDLTKGLLTSRLDITKKKVKKNIVNDTVWTVFHYKPFEWKAYASSCIHGKDTLYSSTYRYDNAGYLKNETRTNKNGRLIAKVDYIYNEYGHCTKMKNFEYHIEERNFYLIDEFRIDYDINGKKQVTGYQLYYRAFGDGWFLKEEYEMGKKGKYSIATEYTDAKENLNFLEYKFEQDFN